eukprot:SAG22_NODE_15222_length_354_cov_0.666667_1_plen_100_part_01
MICDQQPPQQPGCNAEWVTGPVSEPRRRLLSSVQPLSAAESEAMCMRREARARAAAGDVDGPAGRGRRCCCSHATGNAWRHRTYAGRWHRRGIAAVGAFA